MARQFGPVVSGKFYPGSRDELVDRIEGCYTHRYGPGDIPTSQNSELTFPVGIISPHAGYPYSGPIAAHAFNWVAKIGKPKVVIVIGTNHSGLGSTASLISEGCWSTPLGEVNFNTDLAESLLDSSELLSEDTAPFGREHSIEVQLPFLQHLWEDRFSLVPICLKDQSEDVAVEVSKALEKNVPPGTLVVSSTDFTHYESQEDAEKKDKLAIESIMNRDFDAFYKRVRKHHISICGYGSIGVLIDFALKKDLSPTRLKYATSGEVSGYGREVVGYGAIGFRK